jgi:putative ABC transport system permease protein
VAGLVIIGSFGFFYAGIGFIFNLLKKVERFRWKGLNTFTMQQIMKNINTNTLVLTATNLLLAMTITSVVFLVFFKTLFDVEKTSGLPYAYAVLYLDPEKDLSGFDQAANVDPQNPVLRKLSITSYQVQVPVSDLELPGQADANQSILQAGNSACSAVGEDEYNAIRAAKSLASIQLSETEAAVQIGTMQASLDEALRQAAAHALPVTIGARQYRIKQVITSSFVSDIFTSPCSLVLPQAAMSGLSKKHGQTTLLFDYANGKDPLVEKSLEKEIYAVGHGYWTSRGEEAANLQVGQTLIMFSGLYIELILIMACATVLGLQQLIETVESVGSYQTLRYLGADDGAIQRSIFQQVTFYFFAPVGLAVVHSLFALGAFYRLAGGMVAINPLTLAGTFGAFILIYGAYFGVTWRSCVKMILSPADTAPRPLAG